MIYVYAGYYELYVSSKPMAEPYMYQGEFETVYDAELFLDKNFDTDNDTVYYERPLIEDSRIYWFYAPLKDDDDKDVIENYTFDLNENGEIVYEVDEETLTRCGFGENGV